MPIAYPGLRRDLIISRQETGSGVVYVLKDPRIGRFIRFREPEYFIAQQLDGLTSAEEICRRGQEQFGAPLTESTLERFAAKLDTLGLLERQAMPEIEVRPQASPRRMRGNILSLRLTVLDPDSLLATLVPKLRFIFRPWFAWFSIGVILSAAGIMTLQWAELHRSLLGLYRLESIPLAWLTLFCIVVGHEFSHGLTCKYFGGSVHEIGLLLIYLQPAMYCNVSEAWMFPEKRKRLLVTLAGAWFEIFAWAWATIAWRVTEPGTTPNYVALLVATTLGIKTLFNLNPLIKLDGYYLLSDWLEIPNLRRNAFRHIGTSLRHLGRAGASLAAPPTGRERRIFWLYGLLAGTYSAWLLGFILLSLGSFLVARYQGWGLALFMTTIGIVFRHPLRLWLRSLGSQFSPMRGSLRVMRRLTIILVILGGLGAGLYYIQTDFRAGESQIRDRGAGRAAENAQSGSPRRGDRASQDHGHQRRGTC